MIYPVLLFINILFALFWLSYHLPYTLISIIVCAIGYSHIPKILNISGDNARKSAKEINVASFNTSNGLLLYNPKKAKQEKGKEQMGNFLKTFGKIDVFCLQETQGFMQDIMTENFVTLNKHQVKSKGAIIYTKHPIVNKGEIDFGSKTNSCLWADVKIGIDTVRVYSIHLHSNHITRNAELMAKSDINDENTWKHLHTIINKYRNYSQKRSGQVKLVKSHLAKSPHPVIIGGDLNDTPMSYTYAQLSEGLKDCFKEQGNGFAQTFAGVIPFLRIDYILVDPTFNIKSHKIVKEKYSDHYPIIASLQIKS